MPERPLSEDLIEGAEAIGAELGITTRRAFPLLERRAIPAFKLAGRWFARRSTLRSHIEELERAALREPDKPEPDQRSRKRSRERLRERVNT